MITTVALGRLILAAMTDEPAGVDTGNMGLPSLPRHLAALVGALQGPADLGANHDAYLAYASGEDGAGEAASA